MSTSDKNIANDTFPNARTDINGQLVAIASQQSGTADPATMVSYERQARTDLGIVRRRNAANGGWLIDGTLAEVFVIARSSDTILAQANHQTWIKATSTFSQTFTAAATLGDGWWCGYRNDGAGVITLDPNSTEQINGATTLALAPGDSCIIVCDGSGFKTFGLPRTDITSLTEDTAPDVNADFVMTYDASGSVNKKVLLRRLAIKQGAEQASTSGTSIDFTSIPSGTKRITIMFKGVSTSGTDNILIQLGDAGGIEATGYLGSGSVIGASTVDSGNYTTGFGIRTGAAATILHGQFVLNLEDASDFSWTGAGTFGASNTAGVFTSAGSKATSAELDRVRITTSGGTDTFDAGVINILYEG